MNQSGSTASFENVPLICTIGDLVTDTVVHLEREPLRGTDTPATITQTRGGSAANVAVACRVAGSRARFAGRVGKDVRGYELVQALQDHGVETVVEHVGTTGSIVVLVDRAGERSFLTDRRSAAHFSGSADQVLNDVNWLHVPAYSFVGGALATTTQAVIGEAVDRQIPISIATSSVAVLHEYGRKQFLELIAAIRPTFVFANGDEADALSLHQQPVELTEVECVIITNGSENTTIGRADGWQRELAPHKLPHGDLDSTGAGDAFTGGFLSAYLRTPNVVESVRFGHALAARTMQQPGATLTAAPPEGDLTT